VPQLLVVVAHPDDETFGTGSVIASAAAAGVDVTVCCATRGEEGEDTSGTTRNPSELAEVREQELRAAAHVLGAHEVVVLDFADSGFDGDALPGSLSTVELAAIVDPIADLIARVEPDVVVTLDPDSVTDHRDHMRIGQATTAAFAKTAKPAARLYYWTLARSLTVRWQNEMKALGRLPAYVEIELGRPDAEITTVVDVTHVVQERRAAIAAHRTQTSPFDGLSSELGDQFLARDCLVRAVPPWNDGPLETTLFP
jgi:LmbE family N-acetylglucosaminyl deacetylase